MRLLRVLNPAVLLGLTLALTAAAADTPDTTPPRPDDSAPVLEGPRITDGAPSEKIEGDALLRKALEFERARQWGRAIETYEDALGRWPARTDMRHRLRLCESHYRLGRRYQDASFRTVLLRLDDGQSFELYEELLERIMSHYVERVAMEPLLRRGLDNLEVALRDPLFLKTNAPQATPEAVLSLRREFQSWRDEIAAPGRSDAVAVVRQACAVGRSRIGLASPPVVLEFAFGACDALDDYTSYLTPDKLDDLYSMIQGNFVGLGVELKVDPEGLRLMNVLKGGPAWDAGLQPGDRIVKINGKALKGVGLDDAANRLQGPEGSKVTIEIVRGEKENRSLQLVRRPVEVQSVAEAKIVEPTLGVGYIQLTGFQKSSTAEMLAAVRSLERQGMRYLVLDLRGNPGGLLDVAVEIADRFIDQGVIVSTRGRAAGQSNVYRARADGAWTMPLAVLIDHDSASASEILAGALKDHGRAIVLGERSYGKGSVQSIFPFHAAPAGLKITTAKFYSPKDRSYSEQGVEPDVAVRTALKPEQDKDAVVPVFGDPARDTVLETAIRQARRRQARAAG